MAQTTFMKQLLQIWSRLLWPQRLTIFSFGFLALALIGTFVYLMSRVEYETLYRDLNPEDAQAIAGVKGVVAGAVPGLRAGNVSIVDDEGRLLSQSMESGAAAEEEKGFGLREQLERETAGKVVSILEPLAGQGKVHANASIELDYDTAEQTTAPSPQDARYLPGGVRQNAAAGFEADKPERQAARTKGIIRRLSLAVILDHKTVYGKSSDGRVMSASQPHTAEGMDAYRELVLAAVGYNEQRGDVVAIENIPFYSESKPEEQPPAIPWHLRWQAYLLPAIKYGAFIALFFLAYFVIFRPLHRSVFQAMSGTSPNAGKAGKTQPASPNTGEAFSEGRQIGEIGASPRAGAAAGFPDEWISPGARQGQVEREMMTEENMAAMGSRKHEAIKKKLVEKAQRDPESVSRLMRSWLREKV